MANATSTADSDECDGRGGAPRRVLVATGHEGIARLFTALVRRSDTGPVGQVAALSDAATLVRADAVDVAVVDLVSLASLGGLRELALACPVVVVSSLPPEEALVLCLQAGARAFVCQPVDVDILDDAANAVMGGGNYLDSRSAGWLIRRTAEEDGGERDDPEEWLSPRQAEILELSRLGVSLDEIADRLDISVNTVKTHLRRAREKLDFAGSLP